MTNFETGAEYFSNDYDGGSDFYNEGGRIPSEDGMSPEFLQGFHDAYAADQAENHGEYRSGAVGI